MSSARKIAANRANAQRSTGPQPCQECHTPGVAGKQVVIDEDPGRYEALRRDCQIPRYMITMERAYHRAIDQLRETQKLRVKLDAPFRGP